MQQASHEEQILFASQQVVDRGELPGDPDHPTHRRGLASKVVPHNGGRAGVRWDQGGEDPNDRRLAGSVRPEQSEDLPLADRQVDAVEDDLLVVDLAQACNGYGGPRRVVGQCVHWPNAKTLTLGQCQAPIAESPDASRPWRGPGARPGSCSDLRGSGSTARQACGWRP